MSKIGPKEAALKAQREQLKKLEAAVNKPSVQKALAAPSPKAVQKAKARMATMKAPSPKDQLTVALAKNGTPKFFGKKLTFKHVDEAVGIGSDSIPAKKKCTIDHKAVGSIPKELCATCNPDPKRKAPTPKKDNSSAGVTLAPPLAVQKAIAKDLGEETAATKLFEAAAKKKKVGKLPKEDATTRAIKAVVAEKTQPENEEDAMKKATAKKETAKKANGHKPKKESKSDIVHRMLTTKHGATREELHKVTGWPGGANLKVAAARAKMKLVEDKGGRFRLVAK